MNTFADPTDPPEEQPLKKTKKPRWLRKLERESWQAELLISGIALFGTLQLPGLLRMSQNYLLLNSTNESLFYWFFAQSYWVFFVYILIGLFMYHFIIRTLWIGMVGLNSVYPDGIVPTKLSSKHFQEQNQREYGDIDGYINRLDEHASGIFGAGFGYAGIFFNLGFISSIAIFLITKMISWGVSASVAVTGILTIVALMFAYTILVGLLNLPAFRDKEWVRRYQFPLSKIGNAMMYPINNRYTITALSLISSQKFKKSKASKLQMVGSVFLSLIILFFIGTAVASSGLIPGDFIEKVYFREANDPTKISADRYADQDYEGIYFGPVVPSLDHPVDRQVEVWVPLPERELVYMHETCSVPAVDPDAPVMERRYYKYDRNINCAREYIEVFLNDAPVRDYTILREYRTTEAGSQFGVRLRLAASVRAREGINTIKVITQLPKTWEEEGEAPFREGYVPFYGVGE